jgi:hypothetical protein
MELLTQQHLGHVLKTLSEIKRESTCTRARGSGSCPGMWIDVGRTYHFEVV